MQLAEFSEGQIKQQILPWAEAANPDPMGLAKLCLQDAALSQA